MNNMILISFIDFKNGGAELALKNYVKCLEEVYCVKVIIDNRIIDKTQKINQNSIIKNKFINYFNHMSKIITFILMHKPKYIITFKSHVLVIPPIFLIRLFLNLKLKIIYRESNDIKGYSENEIKNKIKKYLFINFIKKIPSYLSDKIFFNSYGSKKNFIKLLNYKKKNLYTIYNPYFFKTNKNISFSNKYIDICFVGRLEPQKDPFIFLEVVSQLILEGVNLTATIIGSGSLFDQVKSKIYTSNLEKHVSLLSYSGQNVVETLTNSKLFFLCSKYEGMPNVILESLNYQCKVISFDISSGPSEILSNECLIHNRSVNEAVVKIKDLIYRKTDKVNITKINFKKAFSKNKFLNDFIYAVK